MPHEMNDKELWQQLKKFLPTTQSCPDPVELAALLDGRLDDDEKDKIETHLAHCPACLENYLAAGPIGDETTLALPLLDWHNLSENICKLAVSTKTGNAAGKGYSKWWKGLELLAASVIFIIISTAGYKTGYKTGASLNIDRNSWLENGNEIANSTSLVNDNMNFDLVEALLAEEPDIEADYEN